MLDSLSLKNTKLGLETLELMKYDPDRIYLLLNRAHSRVGISQSDVEAVLGRTPEFFVVRGWSRADVVLLATWSRTPLLALADTRPGQHLTTLGADEPGKQELAGGLLRDAHLVVDDRELAASMGALAAAGLPASAADATLGEVLRGERPAAHADGTSTVRSVYAPVGLPWQDLALSWLAFREAERRGVGGTVDLLG